ncbi:hypothetical protein IJO12_00675 [bacterium]|nr:hypothetical protein [bacterium]
MEISRINQISQVRQNKNNNKQEKEQNFKGFGDSLLRFFATNQAVGANAVDVAFMVAPRTITDMFGRGPLAGLETFRREIMGTVNDTLIGAYGIAAGATIALCLGLNKKYDTPFNDIMAAPETVKILSENKAKQIKSNTKQIDYIKEIFTNLKAYNPTAVNADAEGYVKLSEKTVNDVSKMLNDVINDDNVKFKKWKKAKNPNSIQVIKNRIIGETGAETKYLLEFTEKAGKEGAKSIKSETSLDLLLKDTYNISKAFNKDKVKNAFKEQIKNNKDITENQFVKSLLKFKKSKAIGGFAIAALVGVLVQPINMYLTKKKTGVDGFVGVEGRTKDDSAGFKALKVGTAAAFGGLVLTTLKTGLKGFMSKMSFHSFWPTIDQLKGVYGITIISRLLSARDKDELRESATKDTLGFLSWLVFGDIVNRITANALDKSVINKTKGQNLFNAKLKTRDEILIKALEGHGISTIKQNEKGEKIALKYKELLKAMDKLPEKIKKATKKQLRTLNWAQLAGYTFSGLVLGFGIPKLNIYLTNKLDKKRKEQAQNEALKTA